MKHWRLIASIALVLIGFLAGILMVSDHRPGLAAPESCEPGDLNGDSEVDLSDAVSLLSFLFLGGRPPAPCPLGPDTCTALSTVVVVRHAEKDTEPLGDPGLTAEGKARAEKLAAIFLHTQVELLIASDFRRTQETLEPLATSKDLSIVAVPTKARPSSEVAEDVAARIAALPQGSLAVVAHHSFTIPAILKALGIEETGDINITTAFDNFLIVQLFAGEKSQLLRLTY